eukprot:7569163-Pyramimonas_sp.AAC.1
MLIPRPIRAPPSRISRVRLLDGRRGLGWDSVEHMAKLSPTPASHRFNQSMVGRGSVRMSPPNHVCSLCRRGMDT